MKYFPLGEVCQINMGQAPDGASYNVTGKGWPLIAGAGDFGCRTPIPKKYTSEPTKLSEADDIILCIRATIGDLNWSDKSYCLGRGVAGLRPIKSKLDSHYLWHFISANKKKLSELGTGSTFKQISRSNIETFVIPLFPLDEQRRIAAILDKADAILRKRQESIHLSDVFIRSTFLDIFGDPVTNPKGWEEVRLQDIADIQSGITKGRKLNGQETLSVPYMRVANVQDGHILLDEIKEIEATPLEIERYRLIPGDILLTEGGDPDKLGRGAVWHGEVTPCIHQNHIFRVRLKEHYAVPSYLSALIGSMRGKQYFLGAAKQTTGIASINKNQLSNFPALLPPIDLQRQFSRIVAKSQGLQVRLAAISELERTCFNSLAHRAFEGEL